MASLSFVEVETEGRKHTGYPEAKLKVLVMVRQVVLLHLAHVRGKRGMMQTKDIGQQTDSQLKLAQETAYA